MLSLKEDELKEILRKYDTSPESLIGLAKTKFQKQTVVEFILRDKTLGNFDKRMSIQENDVKTIKKLVIAIFGSTLLLLLKEPFLQFIASCM